MCLIFNNQFSIINIQCIMATIKTTETTASVAAFIKKIENETKRNDALQLIELMKAETKLEPKMWGPSIIGFGSFHYKYESGHEGDMPLVAFSPRKAEIVLYLSSKFDKREELLAKFGKHKTSKACIYVKKLADVDQTVLKKMIAGSLKYTKRTLDPC